MKVTREILKTLHRHDLVDKPMLAAEIKLALSSENGSFWFAKVLLKDPNPDTWAERFKKDHK